MHGQLLVVLAAITILFTIKETRCFKLAELPANRLGSRIRPIVNRHRPFEIRRAKSASLVYTTTSPLNPLGNDLLIFLFSTIAIVPLFKWIKASPVLGFLAAGLFMGPAGLHLFSDLPDMESLAEFGILFLLFEQGLELTVDRLKSLWKYAFGMGSAQVLLSTIAFFAFPFMGGVPFLEYVIGADASVVDITRIDEAAVIGAALSLSSSAFVLKILQEKKQLTSKIAPPALGILLMQDIAVVPLLVLLPIIESNTGTSLSLTAQAGIVGVTVLKAVAGLGGIVVVGGAVVRAVFAIVAKSQSSETFVALCLLVALGIGALTNSLGLSSTLGAFVAGTLLAESNYRTQVETDIQPFKGLLLGLFFLTTGASVDPYVIQQQWPTVLALLVGLITFKTAILTFLGPKFGLSLADSVRIGLLLSGGGEFAFVVLTLADKLGVLPDLLVKMLVGVVVLSMALTPYLSQLGDWLAVGLEQYEQQNRFISTYSQSSQSVLQANDSNSSVGDGGAQPSQTIVVCGFEAVGKAVLRSLQSQADVTCVAFDLDPGVVSAGRSDNHTVFYGDGSQPMVVHTAGVEAPNAFVITCADVERSVKAVERLHQAFPTSTILARCTNEVEDTRLTEAGADCVVRDDIVTAEVISTALTLLLKAHQTRTVNSQRPVKSPTSLLPLTTGAVSNPTLLSFTTRLRGAYSDSRKQLESIVRSVRSLGEEYVWLSDADLLEQTANAAAKDTEPALASQYSHGESEREVIEGVIVCSLKPQQHDSK